MLTIRSRGPLPLLLMLALLEVGLLQGGLPPFCSNEGQAVPSVQLL